MTWFSRLMGRARHERELREIREEIADLEDRIGTAHVRLETLRERERRLQSHMLLGLTPDEIVRRAQQA